MIYSLRGKLIYSDTNFVVVECGGVGMRCRATLNTIGKLPGRGEEVFLYTHMVVREDAMELYGFATTDELECFKLITGVSGVGPKVGLSILSEFAPDRLAFFISTGDAKAITSASGVGGKLAQRIVLELKDKMGMDLSGGASVQGSTGAPAVTSNTADAISALVSIGYTAADASAAIAKLDPTLPADTLIKQALKKLM